MSKTKEELNRDDGDESRPSEKFIYKKTIIKIVVFCLITITCLLSLIFTNSLEQLLNFNYFSTFALDKANNKIHFIDVGQGDCTVMELIDGKIIMIDTGATEEWNKVNTYFKFLKIPKKIDYLILTHTDKDHIGNTEKLIENFKVENIYLPRVYSNYEASNNLITNSNYKVFDNLMWNNICYKVRTTLPEDKINYINDNFIISNADENLPIEKQYNIQIFNINKQDFYENDNDYCPIIWANIGYYQLLFMADCSKETELKFLNEYSSLINTSMNITLLKVGHHGSNTSTSPEFLQKINPKIAIISCGKNNSYGHPTNETINNLTNENIKIYRTDVDNSIMYADTIKNNSPKFEIRYQYENFDGFYFKLYYLVVGIIVISFLILIVPILSKKYKQLLKAKNKKDFPKNF